VLTLNIGTNNSGSTPTGKLGAIWGSVISWVANHAWSDDIVQGANDVESWGTYAAFNNWEWGDSTGSGYAASKLMLVNFGSADGCPTFWTNGDYPCSSGFTTKHEYYASWGWSPNLAQPQIYYDGCDGYANQPVQWADISAWGAANNLGRIYSAASLSQNYCLSPDQSYSYLESALAHQGVNDTPSYETQIVTK
jgi:hypothetical protein